MAVYLYTEESKTGRYYLHLYKLPSGDFYIHFTEEEDSDKALTILRSQAHSTTAGEGAREMGIELEKLGDDFINQVEKTTHGENLSKEKVENARRNLISKRKIPINKIINKEI